MRAKPILSLLLNQQLRKIIEKQLMNQMCREVLRLPTITQDRESQNWSASTNVKKKGKHLTPYLYASDESWTWRSDTTGLHKIGRNLLIHRRSINQEFEDPIQLLCLDQKTVLIRRWYIHQVSVSILQCFKTQIPHVRMTVLRKPKEQKLCKTMICRSRNVTSFDWVREIMILSTSYKHIH